MCKDNMIATFIETVERYNQLVENPEVELKKACYALDAIEHQKNLLGSLGIYVSLEWMHGDMLESKSGGIPIYGTACS